MTEPRHSALGAAIILLAGVLVPVPLHADAPGEAAVPRGADALFACRSIPDDTARLACFDREAEALQTAAASRKVVIVEQEEIRRTRRDLFGFSLPGTAIFKRDDSGASEDEEEIRAIDDTLAAFRLDGSGRALFTLSNGARWMQIDNLPILGKPGAGDAVRMRAPRSAASRRALPDAGRSASGG